MCSSCSPSSNKILWQLGLLQATRLLELQPAIMQCTRAQAHTAHPLAVRPRVRHARLGAASLSVSPQSTSFAQSAATSSASSTSSSRNLVVAIDHSEGSYKAVQWTLKNLYREGDVLHLLHVVPAVNSVRPAPFSLAAVLPPEEGLQDQMAAHMRDLIETHYMRLAIEYGAQCEVDLVHGKCNQSVSTAIVGKCEELAASVVVLSMQKQGWLDSLFQTDVSKQVADTCSRPTLIYHCDDSTCAPMF